MGRFATAWKAFWGILRSPQRAADWQALVGKPPAEEEESPAGKVEEAKPEPETGLSGDAVYTLVLLQREGRLVDFLQENIEGYSDAQVGAAVRQIHANCRKVLDKNFGVAPVREEQENGAVDVPPSFDPRHVRLLGNPSGEPPFQGVLKHRGWRATKVDFPQRHAKLDPAIIQPAEVEVAKG